MPLAAPASPNRPRSYSAAKVDHRPDAVPTPTILSVEFGSPEGRRWQAIGGGDTLAAAIALARDGRPTDTTWRPVRWNDLHGD